MRSAMLGVRRRLAAAAAVPIETTHMDARLNDKRAVAAVVNDWAIRHGRTRLDGAPIALPSG